MSFHYSRIFFVLRGMRIFVKLCLATRAKTGAPSSMSFSVLGANFLVVLHVAGMPPCWLAYGVCTAGSGEENTDWGKLMCDNLRDMAMLTRMITAVNESHFIFGWGHPAEWAFTKSVRTEEQRQIYFYARECRPVDSSLQELVLVGCNFWCAVPWGKHPRPSRPKCQMSRKMHLIYLKCLDESLWQSVVDSSITPTRYRTCHQDHHVSNSIFHSCDLFCAASHKSLLTVPPQLDLYCWSGKGDVPNSGGLLKIFRIFATIKYIRLEYSIR